MTIILKSTMAGPAGNSQSGDRAELDPVTERQLVDGGYAVFVKDETSGEAADGLQPEAADVRAPETADALQHETTAIPRTGKGRRK